MGRHKRRNNNKKHPRSNEHAAPQVAESKQTDTSVTIQIDTSAGDKDTDRHEVFFSEIDSKLHMDDANGSPLHELEVIHDSKSDKQEKDYSEQKRERTMQCTNGFPDDEKASKHNNATSPNDKSYRYNEAKSQEKASRTDFKSGDTKQAVSTPPPTSNPPDEIIASFRSARKAIENSANKDISVRERSKSLEDVLKNHSDLVDPVTGEICATLQPSTDVVQHQIRLSAAKELVGLTSAAKIMPDRQIPTIPERETANLLTNTAKKLEGKISMVCYII
jgi:hypothetical protein